jgi:hypothetical protein
MKGLIIIALGVVLCAVGSLEIINIFIGYACCLLGGGSISIGINKIIDE